MRMPTPIRRRVSSRETDTTGRTVRRAVWFEAMNIQGIRKPLKFEV
jgi:hypothetical protein